MFKRQLSLYYGSITLWRSLQSIWLWIMSIIRLTASRRDRLHAVVKDIYYPQSSAVFSFGSARSSLAACLQAAGIGPGDDVLLSAYSCLAVPTAVIAVGARPIYLDIHSETLNVDVDAVIDALSMRVRAVVIQHTLGKVVPIKAVVEKAKARGIIVIEDCALSIGSMLDEQRVGTIGDAAIFSMELSKTLSVGWGGILVVNDRKLARAVSTLYDTLCEPSWWSATRDLWQTVISVWCHHPVLFHLVGRYVLYIAFKIGFFRFSTPNNEFDGCIGVEFLMKMSEIQAGIAILQWLDFEKIAKRCVYNAEVLRSSLRQLNIKTPGSPGCYEVSVSPRVSLLIKNRRLMMTYFATRGVELGCWFDGPLSPTPHHSVFNYKVGDYPVAEAIASQVVNLPCHNRITERDLNYIVQLLKQFMQTYPACHDVLDDLIVNGDARSCAV